MIKTMQRDSTGQWVVWEAADSSPTATYEPDVFRAHGYPLDRSLRRIPHSDGSPAAVRILTDSDTVAMQAFHEKISTQSKNSRKISRAEINSEFASSMSEAFDPGEEIMIVATREVDDKSEVIGSVCYTRNKMNFAELSLAIDEEFEGHGIGTRLLERLSSLAKHMGIECATATVHATNTLALKAFRQCGFKMKANTNQGCIIVEKLLWI